jgi:excisionase family DNA binding protein
MTEIILTPMRVDQLETLIENSVKKALTGSSASLGERPDPAEPEFMDVKSTSQFLNLAVPTIYSLVSRRELTSYKRGKKLYFKKSELQEWIQSGRRRSTSELKIQAISRKNF